METGIDESSAAGCFPRGASPYGVMDMSGNVWEWTRSLWGKDWKKPDYQYPYEKADGRENLGAGLDVFCVLRGGSFFYDAKDCRGAFRSGGLPDGRSSGMGFRVVLSPV